MSYSIFSWFKYHSPKVNDAESFLEYTPYWKIYKNLNLALEKCTCAFVMRWTVSLPKRHFGVLIPGAEECGILMGKQRIHQGIQLRLQAWALPSGTAVLTKKGNFDATLKGTVIWRNRGRRWLSTSQGERPGQSLPSWPSERINLVNILTWDF